MMRFSSVSMSASFCAFVSYMLSRVVMLFAVSLSLSRRPFCAMLLIVFSRRVLYHVFMFLMFHLNVVASSISFPGFPPRSFHISSYSMSVGGFSWLNSCLKAFLFRFHRSSMCACLCLDTRSRLFPSDVVTMKFMVFGLYSLASFHSSSYSHFTYHSIWSRPMALVTSSMATNMFLSFSFFLVMSFSSMDDILLARTLPMLRPVNFSTIGAMASMDVLIEGDVSIAFSIDSRSMASM